jgi:hypothetical protein
VGRVYVKIEKVNPQEKGKRHSMKWQNVSGARGIQLILAFRIAMLSPVCADGIEAIAEGIHTKNEMFSSTHRIEPV